jgi:hypothetical protein
MTKVTFKKHDMILNFLVMANTKKTTTQKLLLEGTICVEYNRSQKKELTEQYAFVINNPAISNQTHPLDMWWVVRENKIDVQYRLTEFGYKQK